MNTLEDRDARPGISAVLTWRDDLDVAVLDLAAVLSGLVGEAFEIIVVDAPDNANMADLRARAPGLSLRTESACEYSAAFDLILISAADGQFDVRELNRLMEAVDHGADVAVGYRPRPADKIFRQLSRWGLPVNVDYAFQLIRRSVWRESESNCVGRARRLGYRVVELPVSHRRPTLGSAITANSRAA